MAFFTSSALFSRLFPCFASFLASGWFSVLADSVFSLHLRRPKAAAVNLGHPQWPWSKLTRL